MKIKAVADVAITYERDLKMDRQVDSTGFLIKVTIYIYFSIKGNLNAMVN